MFLSYYFNINGLSFPIKKYRAAVWTEKKKKRHYKLPTRDLFTFKDTCRLKTKGQKKVFHANANQRAGVAIKQT